jgi:hypothetical protein
MQEGFGELKIYKSYFHFLKRSIHEHVLTHPSALQSQFNLWNQFRDPLYSLGREVRQEGIPAHCIQCAPLR